MPLFSVKNSPLLVCCSAETTSSVGLDPLPQRVIVFYCLLVFANLPSSDLSEGPCSTSARQERILSAPSLLGAQGARIPCGSHLVQKEALREVCKRTCWLGWARAWKCVGAHCTPVGWCDGAPHEHACAVWWEISPSFLVWKMSNWQKSWKQRTGMIWIPFTETYQLWTFCHMCFLSKCSFLGGVGWWWNHFY